MAIAGFLLLACSDTTAMQPVDSGANLVDASSCAVPFEDCDGPCQTEQEARDEATLACQGAAASWRSVAGECGSFQYVETDDGVTNVVYYFDAQGSMVSSKITSVIQAYCSNSSFDIAVGPIPSCTRSQEIDLCL